MRAYEIIAEATRRPIISLRHINALKKLKKARLAKAERHNALVQIMYGSPAKELEKIELEKARTELAQEKAELAATKAEAINANKEVLGRMAASGIQIRHDNQEKIEAMASNGLGRLKKL